MNDTFVTDDDVIDFSQLARVLYRHRRLIVGGTVAVAFVAVMVAYLLPRTYRSTGFFQLYNVSSPDYKAYATLFTNPEQFKSFVRANHLLTRADDESLLASFRTAADLDRCFKPVYAYTRDDLRELAQVGKQETNDVLGVQVTAEADNPDQARRLAMALGMFVRDCILFGRVDDYITNGLNRAETESRHLANQVIANRFELKQLETKLGEIRALLKKYPDSRQIVNRELLTVDNGGYRYLSPVTQVVGIESHMADVRQELATNERSQALAALRLDFFHQARQVLDAQHFGSPLYQQSRALLVKLFTGKDPAPDTVQQVHNALTIDYDNFAALSSRMRFASGPTLPERPISPRKALVVIISVVLALLVFVILAFVREWWGTHRRDVLAPEQGAEAPKLVNQ